jgi:hypothetical protein
VLPAEESGDWEKDFVHSKSHVRAKVYQAQKMKDDWLMQGLHQEWLMRRNRPRPVVVTGLALVVASGG